MRYGLCCLLSFIFFSTHLFASDPDHEYGITVVPVVPSKKIVDYVRKIQFDRDLRAAGSHIAREEIIERGFNDGIPAAWEMKRTDILLRPRELFGHEGCAQRASAYYEIIDDGVRREIDYAINLKIRTLTLNGSLPISELKPLIEIGLSKNISAAWECHLQIIAKTKPDSLHAILEDAINRKIDAALQMKIIGLIEGRYGFEKNHEAYEAALKDGLEKNIGYAWGATMDVLGRSPDRGEKIRFVDNGIANNIVDALRIKLHGISNGSFFYTQNQELAGRIIEAFQMTGDPYKCCLANIHANSHHPEFREFAALLAEGREEQAAYAYAKAVRAGTLSNPSMQAALDEIDQQPLSIFNADFPEEEAIQLLKQLA